MRKAKARMAREDPETTINDRAYAVKLLKPSGLALDERRAALAAAGTRYKTEAIEDALRRLHKDVVKTDR